MLAGLYAYLRVADPTETSRLLRSSPTDPKEQGSMKIPYKCQQLLLLRGVWGAFVYTVMFQAVDPLCNETCLASSDQCSCGPVSWGLLTLARIPLLIIASTSPALFGQLRPLCRAPALLAASMVLFGVLGSTSNAWIGVPACMGFIALHMSADLHLSTEINSLIDDQHRATIISIGSMITMMIYAVGNAILQSCVNEHGYGLTTYCSVFVAHSVVAVVLFVAIAGGIGRRWEGTCTDFEAKGK